MTFFKALIALMICTSGVWAWADSEDAEKVEKEIALQDQKIAKEKALKRGGSKPIAADDQTEAGAVVVEECLSGHCFDKSRPDEFARIPPHKVVEMADQIWGKRIKNKESSSDTSN